ncbi:MAG: ester cyclase, partial [Actinomycetota bacterium]|nr:ester cyclase [Actinomycetota bacterium]
MTEAENKEFFRRYIEVVFNDGRHDLLPDFVLEDAVDHDPVPDAEGLAILEGLTAFLEMRRRAFPDLRYTIDEVMAEGDK